MPATHHRRLLLVFSFVHLCTFVDMFQIIVLFFVTESSVPELNYINNIPLIFNLTLL